MKNKRDWIASILIIIGYALIALWGNPWGFFIQMAGCAIYMDAYLKVNYAIFAVNSIFFLINLIGILEWAYKDAS